MDKYEGAEGEGDYSIGFNEIFYDVKKFLDIQVKKIKKEIASIPKGDKKVRKAGRRDGIEYMMKKIER